MREEAKFCVGRRGKASKVEPLSPFPALCLSVCLFIRMDSAMEKGFVLLAFLIFRQSLLLMLKLTPLCLLAGVCVVSRNNKNSPSNFSQVAD